MHKKRECKIQSIVNIICPSCSKGIQIPMCKAVNGEEIMCQFCHKKFKFTI